MAYYDPNGQYADILKSFGPTVAPSTQGRQGGHGRRAGNPGDIGDAQAGNVEDFARRTHHVGTAQAYADRAAGIYPRNAKKAARQAGLDTLLQILASQGHTDPGALNMQLTDISRGAEAGQNSLDEYLASMGLSGSGVGLATRAAIGASGTAERSRAIAEENRLAEERKRQDLALIVSQILGPRLTRRGQDKALEAALAGGGGSNLGAYGNLLGGLGQLIGSYPSTSQSQPTYGSEYRDPSGWQPGGGGTWA